MFVYLEKYICFYRCISKENINLIMVFKIFFCVLYKINNIVVGFVEFYLLKKRFFDGLEIQVCLEYEYVYESFLDGIEF